MSLKYSTGPQRHFVRTAATHALYLTRVFLESYSVAVPTTETHCIRLYVHLSRAALSHTVSTNVTGMNINSILAPPHPCPFHSELPRGRSLLQDAMRDEREDRLMMVVL